MERIRRAILEESVRVGGRHDEPEIYARPAGDPGLIGPGSVSWELHSDLAALAAGGTAAIVMEILHPRVMAGVHEFSGYREDPLRRARNTFGYVIRTTFGNTEAAERIIHQVRSVHERVTGTAPDGTPYRAMDPELLGWVHTCIPWGVMRAYERGTRRLTPGERARYLAEQAVIAHKAGAGRVPVTMTELDDYIEEMRPRLAVTDQTREFLAFARSAPLLPPVFRPVRKPLQFYNLHAALALMPGWARRMTGYHHPALLDRLVVAPHARLDARLMRWAFRTPAFRAMAETRVGPVPGARTDAGPERSGLAGR